jgi:hypothetical protein
MALISWNPSVEYRANQSATVLAVLRMTEAWGSLPPRCHVWFSTQSGQFPKRLRVDPAGAHSSHE